MANVFAEPSFETGLGDWVNTSGDVLERVTTDASHGTACARVTSVGGGNSITVSGLYPAAPGQRWSAGLDLRYSAGTARQLRLDIRWYDTARVNIGGTNGFGDELLASAAWQRCTLEGATAPASVAFVAIRTVYLQATAGDSVLYDAAQLEQGDTLPPYNPTGEDPVQVSYIHNGTAWVPAATSFLG